MNLILVCDKAGQPHHWATWEDAIVQKVKGNVSYEFGDTSIFRGGVSRITGNRSEIDIKEIIFLREQLKYDPRTPPLTNKNLFARDLHICCYCGRFYPEHKLSRDHIIPTSQGGPNTWKNCITACKTCNHAKADRTPEQADMEMLYIPYTPSHVEKLILQNRRVLTSQMEFLSVMLPEHSRLRKG